MAKKSLPQIYGVLGFPAKHSLSPKMHNAAFKAAKINAHYRIFEVEPSGLKHFISSLSKRGILGLNVTIPYKQTIISYISRLSPQAAVIGAVNTVKVSGNKLLGYNTDADGFIRSLKTDLGFDPRGKNIAVLGAGGAGRAVCVALADAAAGRIAVYNRDRSKTIDLMHTLNMNSSGRLIAANSVGELGLADTDLLVNTTSVGMKENDLSLVDKKLLRPDMLVYDLVYNRKATKLLEDAVSAGCRVSNGLGMLLHQGELSFKVWTGRMPPKKVMEKALGL
ncbi:MAG: shikimate dehydrogenase [Candidatus Omnitrophica bacterium]|jgi:shikimate dehydrogenase|nr:shikimate dehydrogenase [Candidatus Omnitrophota bacterium]